MKRLVSMFLMLTIVLSLVCTVPIYADSVDSAIQARIDELYNLLGNTHFTVDREAAGNKEDDCLVSNVIATTWFKDKFGISGSSTSQFPTSARYPNSQNAYSCTGFSLFAEWYIFKNSNSDSISTNKLNKMSFNYSNVLSNAKVGDLISLSGNKYNTSGEYVGTAGHEAIFISANSNGITVLDSNWGNSCKVTKHTIGYYYCDYFQIARATTRGEVTPAAPPATAKLSIDKEKYDINETVIFTLNGGDNINYTLAIYKEDTRIDTIEVRSSTYTKTFSESGSYSAYMTAYNDAGYKDSNWVSWEINKPSYTILYDANGGVGSMSSSMHYDDEYKNLDACTFTKMGYNFIGWSTSPDGRVEYKDCENVVNIKTWAGKVTLYAQWEPSTYTILYDGNGGIGIMEGVIHTYDEYKNLDACTFTKMGYNFIGWSTSPDGRVEYKDCENVVNIKTWAGKVTLYAQWEPSTYTILYDGNGGIGIMEGVIHTYDEYRNLDACTFAKMGYNFIGWSTSPNGGVEYKDCENVVNIKTWAGKVTLYAQWEPSTYTMLYDGNGGIGIMEGVIHTYDEYKNLDACTFTKMGYNFIGWSTSPNGGVEYTDCESVVNIKTWAGKVTLYAQWEKATPYIESTVTKSGEKLIIDTKVQNITAPYDVLIVGYKGNKFVTMKHVPHDEQNSPYTFEGDIDEIKVMVWKDLLTPRPLCEAEIIPSNKFIIE